MKGDTALALLAACKAQHEALDRLFAQLLELTIKAERPFYPSESGQPWAAIVQGNTAIEQAERELAKAEHEMKTITIEVSDTVHALLEVLTYTGALDGHRLTVEQVLQQLVDHVQQGVYRPGAWERGWLVQAFGDHWIRELEPGDPYGRQIDGERYTHGRPLFQRPKGFKPK